MRAPFPAPSVRPGSRRIPAATLPATALLALLALRSPAPAQPAAVDPATAGTIRVSVLLRGDPPAAREISLRTAPRCAAAHSGPVYEESVVASQGRLANAVVYLKEGLGGRAFAAPAEPVKMDQKGCLYTPRVVAAMVAQPVEFWNSDAEAHNVHGKPSVAKPWNFLMSRPKSSKQVFFDKPEVGIPVRCDIHPWMIGYVSVFDHPYFGVTGADGTVTLKQVPPGAYTVEVWHEKLGTKSTAVQLPQSGSAAAEVTFDAPAK